MNAVLIIAPILFCLWQTWRSWRYYQRHKVRVALLRRCDTYIARQRQMIVAGNLAESRRLGSEIDTLLNQVKESLSNEF